LRVVYVTDELNGMIRTYALLKKDAGEKFDVLAKYAIATSIAMSAYLRLPTLVGFEQNPEPMLLIKVHRTSPTDRPYPSEFEVEAALIYAYEFASWVEREVPS